MTTTEIELINLIRTSDEPDKAIIRAAALLTEIVKNEAFFETCKALFESENYDGLRKLIDSIVI